MIIDGHIEEVMESIPLQLLVRTNGDRVSVNLLDETIVTKSGNVLDHGVLMPGLKVSIRGSRAMPDGMVAEKIQIFD